MHSWRALMLPELGVHNYRLHEPWDSKHNLEAVRHASLKSGSLSDDSTGNDIGIGRLWPRFVVGVRTTDFRC